MKFCIKIFLFIVVFCYSADLLAQPGTSIELEKPEQYENRTLASEKTGEKKFTAPKRFFNNTVTHYNYYFNANLRLNDIIERAKQSIKDDYTKLLPFYNYSLDVTSSDGDIDSIIYKCNAGILLHDLRSDWVDDMYFLMGKAYLLRKNFDSAGMVFRYLNYAFAPKDDGYDIPIGSNASGSNVFSISTNEKKDKRFAGKPPRRNEALLWMARNYLEEGKLAQGAGILEILAHDPQFPERLNEELSETIAYRYYLVNGYDSSAYYLSKSISIAGNKQDEARREFLTGQLYMLANDNENASKYFSRSAEHTIDPVMAVYASLNSVIASSGDTSSVPEEKIQSLQRLAQKERYRDYRDIIYYNLALAELERKNTDEAKKHLQKSISVSIKNPAQKSNSFLLLGDLNLDEGNFTEAAHDYDSVDASSITDEAARNRYMERSPLVKSIADNLDVIHREDSLQKVAAMPADERTAFIKKTLRKLLKEQGIKDADAEAFINPAVQSTDNDLAGPQQQGGGNDIFSAGTKGDWYFNNQSLKAAGFQTFKTTWGSRPNVDNWNRMEALNAFSSQNNGDENAVEDNSGDETDSTGEKNSGAEDQQNEMIKNKGKINDPLAGKRPFVRNDEMQKNAALPTELSYDALLDNVPTTEEKMDLSNQTISQALFDNGQIFQNKLESYSAAAQSYELMISKYPDSSLMEETLFNLCYCYKKLGRNYSYDSVLNALNTNYPDGKFTAMLKNKPSSAKENKTEDVATKEYERIYDLFISGKFEEAETAKQAADAKYDNSYWTPQLLYIESIYHVSERQDSAAIEELTNLKDMYASSPLAEKAETMIDVLSRRTEIEDYLTNLNITRYTDEQAAIINLNPVEQVAEEKKEEPKNDSAVVVVPTVKQTGVAVDTSHAIKQEEASAYAFNPTDGQYIAVLLNGVAPVYVNETKNAFTRYNAANFYNQKISASITKLSDTFSIVLLGPFTDAATALIYSDKVKPVTPTTILPWLKADKYSFIMISDANLAVMNRTKDIDGYRKLIQQALPGKF